MRVHLRSAKPISTPYDVRHFPKYKACNKADILKKDHERIPIIDFLIMQFYRCHILLEQGSWIESFIVIFRTLGVINFFNDFVLYIRACFILVLILNKMQFFE